MSKVRGAGAWWWAVLCTACVDDVWLGPEQARDAGAGSALDGSVGDDGDVVLTTPSALPDAGDSDDAAQAADDGGDDAALPALTPPPFCGLEDCRDPAIVVRGCDSTRVCWPSAMYGNCSFTCEPAPRCGRAGDAPCGEGEFCLYSLPDALCGAGQAGGFCAPRPLSCERALVGVACGCDGRSYETQCAAAQQGMSIAHKGACDATPGGAGGGTNGAGGGTNGGFVGN